MQASSAVARALTAFVCAVAFTAAVGAAPATAASTTATKADAALRRTALSWVHWAANGNARKACLRQTEPMVNGIPCAELPNYFQTLYCPAFESAPDGSEASFWRSRAETVVKVRTGNGSGSAIFRSTQKSSRVSVKANFIWVDDEWRVASLQRADLLLSPAGLIFTEGAELEAELWPAHC
jgi:hypothetical protein